MSKEKRYNDVPISEIPEVAAYHDVKARYEAFRAANPEFFQYLDALQEEFNQKLQDANKVVRSKGISCGDFELYQYQTRYNAEELLQGVGRDRFLRVGGKETTQTIRSVDKARFQAACAAGEVPPEVAERVETKTPKYHAPDPIVVP